MPAPRTVPSLLRRSFVTAALAGVAVGGCIVDEVTVPDPPATGELAPGQTTTVELRFLRFEVDGFQQVMTIDDVRAF